MQNEKSVPMRQFPFSHLPLKNVYKISYVPMRQLVDKYIVEIKMLLMLNNL